MKRVLIAGAGGFIGHHLVNYTKERGYWVRGADIKEPEFEKTRADEYLLMDLREFKNCRKACEGMDEAYQLAADMGGIGYISAQHAGVVRNNTLINMHMLEAARLAGVKNYLYTSSACVYPAYLQKDSNAKMLKEADAYPADAEPGYGWEKLFAELACSYYSQDYGFKAHIVRFHNIFGILGAYEGGREKSPAALCRKIALAKNEDEIDIWGDGRQTRSYCYIDDCIEGLHTIMQSNHYMPINLGQDRIISINELVDIISEIAGKTIKKRYNLSMPQGVRGRNADITLMKEMFNWQPKISLEQGLEKTYRWISDMLKKDNRR